MNTVICGKHGNNIAMGVRVDDCPSCIKESADRAELEARHEAAEGRLRQAAAEFLHAHHRRTLALATIKRETEAAEKAEDDLSRLRAELERSVQPVCGSAHQPSRRIYWWPNEAELVVVNWDHGSDRGRRGGAHVSVERPL